MKTILKTLRNQFLKVEKLIEKREKIYESRSERWKESENGAVYESDTLDLEFVKDNLEEAVKSLVEITGHYE